MSERPMNLGDLGYPTVETVRLAQGYHAILTDLIAELRWRYGDLGLLEEYRPVVQACWKAEARLRELDTPTEGRK